ncbi:hypothetical protein CONPUDRAFT_83853 [Coniophora puteana RWD-64-598 SS2]|uniref:Uncharacterized protein n=1 Tax=Coniophora puteana (strain RWD-64-598) TaxID=741705 RepID=A0A5M3MIK1_CONPW|nr:uncharacterized protein CONPUDRAFT_83853 [Coniophora puteana RWD-64-598 SS2]EIW78451.1 hypothetical protein CONPUDRAFT_83853 [Coniophora puteana RWD-64-598 SS2]
MFTPSQTSSRAIASSGCLFGFGSLRFATLTSDTVQKWITESTSGAGIGRVSTATFSTHCFRRGGAQYRFMHAKVGSRWPLNRVRWWGGWAEGESVSSNVTTRKVRILKYRKRDTLIRYLLDELHCYETDHSNALCPTQVKSTTR